MYHPGKYSTENAVANVVFRNMPTPAHLRVDSDAACRSRDHAWRFEPLFLPIPVRSLLYTDTYLQHYAH